MITWNTFDPARNRVEIVETADDLDELLELARQLFWEDISRKLVEFFTDEDGVVVATAMFGPGLSLMVACSDGRVLQYEKPRSYGRMP